MNEQDLRIDTHSNISSNSVRVTHLPTGFIEECSENKSQLLNRQTAIRRLTERLEAAKPAPIADFLGTPIEVGSKIVYASMVGRSPRLTLGEVLEVGKPKSPTSYYKVSIKVQPIEDSWGSRYSTDEFKDGKYQRNVNKAKPVSLHFTNRLMVIK